MTDARRWEFLSLFFRFVWVKAARLAPLAGEGHRGGAGSVCVYYLINTGTLARNPFTTLLETV